METPKSRLTPYQRGFYCGDQSIAYPIKDETIPDIVFIPLFGCSLILFVVIAECLKVQALTNASCNIRNILWKPLLAGLTIAALFGLLFIVDVVIKFSVGELRPNFLAICRPNWGEINCTDSEGNPQYIFPIPCNETKNYILQKARTSFFSGHASLSAFSVTVIILYLNDIYQRPSTCVSCVRHLVQSLLVMLAFYMGLSRIWDHVHHWWDVAIGFLFGTIVGYVVKKQVLDVYFSKLHNVKGNEAVPYIDPEANQRASASLIENDTSLTENGVEFDTTNL